MWREEGGYFSIQAGQDWSLHMYLMTGLKMEKEGIAEPENWTLRTDRGLTAFSMLQRRHRTMSPSGALGPQESTQAYHAGKGGRSQTGLCCISRLPDHCFMEASRRGPHLEDHGKWNPCKASEYGRAVFGGVENLLMS